MSLCTGWPLLFLRNSHSFTVVPRIVRTNKTERKCSDQLNFELNVQNITQENISHWLRIKHYFKCSVFELVIHNVHRFQQVKPPPWFSAQRHTFALLFLEWIYVLFFPWTLHPTCSYLSCVFFSFTQTHQFCNFVRDTVSAQGRHQMDRAVFWPCAISIILLKLVTKLRGPLVTRIRDSHSADSVTRSLTFICDDNVPKSSLNQSRASWCTFLCICELTRVQHHSWPQLAASHQNTHKNETVYKYLRLRKGQCAYQRPCRSVTQVAVWWTMWRILRVFESLCNGFQCLSVCLSESVKCPSRVYLQWCIRKKTFGVLCFKNPFKNCMNLHRKLFSGE